MHNIKQMNSLPQNQNGATLIVALILLVLISLIGVSTLKSASIVEKMSSNDYQKNITFRASESAVDLTLENTQLISQAIRGKVPLPLDDVAISVDNAEANIIITPVGSGPVAGASIGAGGVSGQRLMITSTGTIANNPGTETRTVHGIVQILPGQ